MSAPGLDIRSRVETLLESARRLDRRIGAALRGGIGSDPGVRARGPVLLWRRIRFSKRVRAETWQLLADAMAGGSQVGRVIEAVAEGYRLSGQRIPAAVLLEIRAGIGEARLTERLAPYTGTAERLVFEGLATQDPTVVCASAARILRMELAFRKAVNGALALPALLLAGLLGLLYFFGLELLPALQDLVDFDRLPAFQQRLVDLALGFAARPLLPVTVMAILVATLLALMRYWTGLGRTFADRFPPFSTQRLLSGVGFLFAVVEYGRSGQAVTTRLLERVAQSAPPYAASRIRAVASEFVSANNNLGTAALRAGQGFPADEITAVLRVLWNEQDGIHRVGEFLERWMGRMETAVKARMAVLNAVLLTALAGALVAFMSIALPIVDQISQGVG